MLSSFLKEAFGHCLALLFHDVIRELYDGHRDLDKLIIHWSHLHGRCGLVVGHTCWAVVEGHSRLAHADASGSFAISLLL